ncbi:bifunctional DNA primase/polymerase [Streptomyces albidoflavus]|uniref:bifunctional DNA primase/polymerase n=1 Tax=Streptomyces albidoflavus TaxID=1886 RepID=UPI00340F9FFB
MQCHGESPAAESAPAPREVALWLAGKGFPVHPLAPGRKTPAANCPTCRSERHAPESCPCPAQGRWCHGFHSATTNPERIQAWWSHEPAFGVGVACGPANLVVLDVDAHAAEVPTRDRLLPGIPISSRVNLQGLASGYDTLALLAAFRGQDDPAQDQTTLRVRTPSGGLHIWYRNPAPQTRYRSSTGSGPRTALAWQVDVRAHRGYIVAPSTRTPDGPYTPLGTAREPATLPLWLAAELRRTGHVLDALTRTSPVLPAPRSRPATTPRPEAAQRALKPLLDQVSDCHTVAEGAGFTEKLNRAAWTAGGMVGGGHLDRATARELLTEAAHHARPHQIRRNETIIDAALEAGAARPFHPRGTT